MGVALVGLVAAATGLASLAAAPGSVTPASALALQGLVRIDSATASQLHPQARKINGSVCKNRGSERTVEGVVYTCRKQGKKFVWVRRPASQEVPTWARVAKEIQDRVASRAGTPGMYAVRHDPAIPSEVWQRIAQEVSAAYTPWSQAVPMSRPVPLLIMNENSGSWFTEQARQLQLDCGLPPTFDQVTPSSAGGFVCSDALGEPVMILYVGSRNASGFLGQLIEHETVHVAQWILTGASFNSMPCWLFEGQANLYASTLARPPAGNWPDVLIKEYRRSAVSHLVTVPSLRQSGYSKSAMEALLVETEERGSGLCLQDPLLAYTMGHLVNEKLVADFGEDRVFDWMRNTRTSGNWKVSFAEVFGIDTSSWYTESAARYLAEAVASTRV